ncbi:MAG: hypothetical protein Q4G33_00355 [bacterium]|nr:hypothetical protein [bacterium]
MDYQEVRKREKIKKRGGNTSGRKLGDPKRVDYGKRRSTAVLIVLSAIVLLLGAAIIKTNNISFSILPAPPTAEPIIERNNDTMESGVLTDGSGNALPTVEPPNTYSLD